MDICESSANFYITTEYITANKIYSDVTSFEAILLFFEEQRSHYDPK